MKSYYLGAMFYGVFIVSMVLNFAAIVDSLNAGHANKFPTEMKRRWLTGLIPRLVPLAVVSFVFVSRTLLGQITLATTLDQNSIQDIRAATERVWSLLKESSISPKSQPETWYGNTLVVSFSSPYPVTSSTIQLYAVQAHAKLDVRGEYFVSTPEDGAKRLSAANFAVVTSSIAHNLPGPRMGDELIRLLDGDPNMCLVDSMALLNTRVMRIYHHSDRGCGFSAPGGD